MTNKAIEFIDVVKQFAGTPRPAVDRLSLSVDEGRTLALVGPSGCGKTTTLKMINRLVEPTSGNILINGRGIMEQPVLELRRSLGYVIQHIGLFPNMTVARNIAVVPGLLGWDRRRIEARVDELLALVGLDPGEFRDRRPRQLSGGQQQRIGVARALAADPPILLMDEPFGALDPITRANLQRELAMIQKRLRKTIVIVTHDMDEAVKLADEIAVMKDGRIAQLGSPMELLARPENAFIADLLGEDRLIKLLQTLAVSRLMKPGASSAGETVAASATMHDALLIFLATGAEVLSVRDEKGAIVGAIAREACFHASRVI
jgi:osmoprotectant transport system ATP-binding protein